MNQKAKRILLVIIFIFILIVFGFLIIILNLRSVSNRVSYIYNDEIYDDLVYPSHSFIISNNYDGEISLKTINKSINYFCSEAIYDLVNVFKEDHSDESITKFFNMNKKNIQMVSGITEYDDFYDLVNSISKLDSNNLVLKRIEIDTEEYEWNGDIFECYINVYYENDCELLIRVAIEEDFVDDDISPIQYKIMDDN